MCVCSAEYQCAVKLRNIPKDCFLASYVWEKFYELQHHKYSEKISPNIMYRCILQYFCEAAGKPSFEEAAGKRKDPPAVKWRQQSKRGHGSTWLSRCRDGVDLSPDDTDISFETAQRSGTCYLRCWTSCLKYLLKSYTDKRPFRLGRGLAEERCKYLFYLLRMEYLNCVEKGLQALAEMPQCACFPELRLDENDTYMLEISCGQTSRAALRGHEQGYLDVEDLRRTESTIKSITDRTVIFSIFSFVQERVGKCLSLSVLVLRCGSPFYLRFVRGCSRTFFFVISCASVFFCPPNRLLTSLTSILFLLQKELLRGTFPGDSSRSLCLTLTEYDITTTNISFPSFDLVLLKEISAWRGLPQDHGQRFQPMERLYPVVPVRTSDDAARCIAKCLSLCETAILRPQSIEYVLADKMQACAHVEHLFTTVLVRAEPAIWAFESGTKARAMLQQIWRITKIYLQCECTLAATGLRALTAHCLLMIFDSCLRSTGLLNLSSLLSEHQGAWPAVDFVELSTHLIFHSGDALYARKRVADYFQHAGINERIFEFEFNFGYNSKRFSSPTLYGEQNGLPTLKLVQRLHSQLSKQAVEHNRFLEWQRLQVAGNQRELAQITHPELQLKCELWEAAQLLTTSSDETNIDNVLQLELQATFPEFFWYRDLAVMCRLSCYPVSDQRRHNPSAGIEFHVDEHSDQRHENVDVYVDQQSLPYTPEALKVLIPIRFFRFK